MAFVEADAPRVTCRRHGVVVCAVPWARHDARSTRAFEDRTAWLAVHCSKAAVAQLMRIAWRTVGGICERVAQDAARDVDLLAGLRRIGIDEISHRRGQRYLTVVACHDTGRLIWAAPGSRPQDGRGVPRRPGSSRPSRVPGTMSEPAPFQNCEHLRITSSSASRSPCGIANAHSGPRTE